MIKQSLWKNSLINPGKQWHAVYTLYRHEKKIAEELQKKGIEVYIPLVNRVRRYNRKIKRYEVPLINNYVFLKISPEQYIIILNAFGVIKFIKNAGKISVIPEYEIDYLKLITGEMQNVEAESLNRIDLTGRDVMIIEGPLLGLKAKVIDRSNNNVLILTLENIGYNLIFEIDTKIIKVL
jgi:transcription antitermination factor NusG